MIQQIRISICILFVLLGANNLLKSQNYLAVVNQNGKWGYINQTGNFEISPQYQYAKSFSGNKFALVKNDNKWGAINASGEVIIPIKYEKMRKFSNGMFAVFKNGLWGYSNEQGEIVISFKYKKVKKFKNEFGLALRNDDKWVLVSKSGEEIKPNLTSYKLFEVSDGRIMVYDIDQRKFGFMDLAGNWVVDPLYEKAKTFKEERAMVLLKGKWGFINTKGTLVVPLKYSLAKNFSDGMARVEFKDLWYYVNKDGKELKGEGFTLAFGFFEGYAAVMTQKDKYGLINKEGEFTIPPRYDKIKDVEGLPYVGVRLGKKWGFCHVNGREVIEPQFKEVDQFRNGLAAV